MMNTTFDMKARSQKTAKALRVLHFSPAERFSKKFLFHPALNIAEGGVHYFDIGKSGYAHDRTRLFGVLREYLRAARLLVSGISTLNRSTIAYCHTTRFALPSLLLCRLLLVRQVIYFNHGVPYIGHQGLKRTLLRLVERLNVAVAHRFVTVSPSMVTYLQQRAGADARAHATWPGSSSGLRESDYLTREQLWRRLNADRSRQAVRFLYAGRLEARKGLFVLLEAWRTHSATFPEDELWLCGFTAEKLAAHGRWLELPGLRVLGYVDGMKEIYDAIDVVVSPSFHEGFGYTLLEGAARGCCIISSAVPGPDVMFSTWMRDHLFKAGDSADLKRVMAHLRCGASTIQRGRLLSYRSALRFSTKKLQYPDV
jgi:glycosyltransferase involved in cell wall biosynthesis